MTGPVDLAIVSSPLQYLNAVEWRSHRASRSADLVRIGDRAGGAGAIDTLMARRPNLWRTVVFAGARPRPAWGAPPFARDVADLIHRRALANLARRLAANRYAAIAYGDHRNVSQRFLVERMVCDDLTLLDDGSITPQAARSRTGAADPRFAPLWFRTRLAAHAFGDPPPADPERLAFFTIYGRLIADRLRPGDRVRAHAYDSWRSAAPHRSDDAIWILGANHAEAGICTHEDYAAVILGGAAALRAEAPGRSILYRPHRGEAPSKVQDLARSGGFPVAASPLPVEIAYLDAAARPAAVAVVASSAADTLGVLDPNLSLVRFALPETYLRRQRDHILAVISAHHAFNPRLRVVSPTAAMTETRDVP